MLQGSVIARVLVVQGQSRVRRLDESKQYLWKVDIQIGYHNFIF